MKKGPPERSEGVLLSTARRDNGFFHPLHKSNLKDNTSIKSLSSKQHTVFPF